MANTTNANSNSNTKANTSQSVPVASNRPARATVVATANDRYWELNGQIESQISQLKAALAQHALDQSYNTRDYSYVGDLGEVSTKLAELLEFMTGQPQTYSQCLTSHFATNVPE